MKQSIVALALIAAASARPASFVSEKREVPQEHSHQNIIDQVNKAVQLNNPDNIGDGIFGLLGAKAAAEGAGKIADPDCLQQATADQAFTNAKAAGDVAGMTAALIYRALERNTGSVGLASVPCKSIKAVNPEIAALQQHQDPAGTGAQALNKQIATDLAKQIAAVGGDATLANEASTFAPGKLGDPTAAGNTCDDANDAAGCINSKKLRVDDLSAAEIQAASVGAAGAAANVTGAANNATGVAAGNQAAQGAKKAKNGKKAKKAKKAKDAKKAKAGNAQAGNAQAGDAQGANAQAGNAQAGNAQAGNAQAGNANAAAGAAAAGGATGAAAGAAASGAADFGTCSNLDIKFGKPSDGRKEDAFEPADLATFNHGSALNIGVISNFICSQAKDKCKANAAAVDKCNQAATAASGLKAAAAADAFNKAIAA